MDFGKYTDALGFFNQDGLGLELLEIEWTLGSPSVKNRLRCVQAPGLA